MGDEVGGFEEEVDVLWGLTFQSVRGSYPDSVLKLVDLLGGWSTFGVDQFNLGTTDPLSNAISRVKRAVKSASGSSLWSPSFSSCTFVSASSSISSISDIRLLVLLYVRRM